MIALRLYKTEHSLQMSIGLPAIQERTPVFWSHNLIAVRPAGRRGKKGENHVIQSYGKP
jgi:hypothetical protein